MMKNRVPVREQKPEERVKNFKEVSFGYNHEEALLEAERCLQCRNPRCVGACPVAINIPKFIQELKDGHIGKARDTIGEASNLPAVCGRVCPQ